MTESNFPYGVLIFLSFVAGFACAIWIAVTIEDGAKKISEHEQGE
jgi:zinc transporter ZupT